MKITEADVTKCTEFLNAVATYAKFTLDTKQLITYYKLLAWAQQELLPKLEANVFEIKSVKEYKSND